MESPIAQGNLDSLIASGKLLAIDEYDTIVVSYSGGKDSLAVLLHLFDLGVRRDRIELWHQHVDGEPGGEGLMDWPCTEAYVRATGKAFGITTLFQWKDGGFEREMLRENTATAPVSYESIDGSVVRLASKGRVRKNTRLKFPQVSADLSVRWCSAYLKIDVASRVIRNDNRFDGRKVLFVTGERRQESSARSQYNEAEQHRTNINTRRVDHWRPVIDWTEKQVWEIIARYRVLAHPAYALGFSRVSCMACIFGSANQWATVKHIASQNFNKISSYEQQFGKTIHRSLTVIQRAERGTPYEGVNDPELVRIALSRDYPADRFFVPEGEDWVLPRGAFGESCGPS